MILIHVISGTSTFTSLSTSVATGRASAAQQVINIRTALKRLPLALFAVSGMSWPMSWTFFPSKSLRSSLSCAA